MTNYVCKLQNNVVTEIIVADFNWVQNNLNGVWHDLGGEPLTVALGYTYDADADVFVAPVSPDIESEV